METTPNNKENINTETVQHTEALSEAELNEKKRIEFEALLEVQSKWFLFEYILNPLPRDKKRKY